MSIYFHDTYALIEILRGNKSFEKYDQFDFVTTKLNLMELHYQILKTREENPDIIYQIFEEGCVEITREHIFKANRLKLKNKKISYVDAIGYVIAKENKIKFLTGDKEFEDLPNVEFVK